MRGVPPLAVSGNLASRSGRIISELLIFSAFLFGANTKFVWKFFGSPTQALEINSVRVSACDDSCSNADDNFQQDQELLKHTIRGSTPQAVVRPSPSSEPECPTSAWSQLASPALWHRPPPDLL
jgi:hypothetical protein